MPKRKGFLDGVGDTMAKTAHDVMLQTLREMAAQPERNQVMSLRASAEKRAQSDQNYQETVERPANEKKMAKDLENTDSLIASRKKAAEDRQKRLEAVGKAMEGMNANQLMQHKRFLDSKTSGQGGIEFAQLSIINPDAANDILEQQRLVNERLSKTGLIPGKEAAPVAVPSGPPGGPPSIDAPAPAAAEPEITMVNRQTGQRIRLDRKTNQWVPVK